MRSIKFQVALAAFMLAGFGVIGCTNQDGAGGTTDGTSAEAYDFGTEKDLAPAMDSVNATAPSTVADTTKAASGKSGE